MKKLKLILVSILSVFTIAVTVNQSFGWFGKKYDINSDDKLGGNFTTSYFHAGKGTKDKPFEITKPFHYENMIKLHYEQPAFATAGYYFKFGSTDDRMPGEPTTPVFYYTDENGNVDPSKTSDTLYLGGKELPPLGTAEYPFRGHLDGSSLTIRKFTIAGSGYYDVGIFGYVDLNTDADGSSPIHDAYWREFTIDTTGISDSAHKHTIATEHPERAHYDNDTAVQLGYLAGHTVYSSAFSNCYVNSCEVKSSNHGAKSNTSYGYFGKAENDFMGGSTGKGTTYSYKLDSEVIYRSTRQIYDSISDNPIRTRDTYTEYTTPINGETPEIYSISGGTKTRYPLSGAISKTRTSSGYDTYTLQGSTPTAKQARNYSFSTIGYQPTTTSTTSTEYQTYYTYGDTTKKNMPKAAVQKDDWKGKSIDVTTKDSTSTLSSAGDFFYHNGTEWRYIHSENSSTSQKAAKSFTINVSNPGSHTFSGMSGLGNSATLRYAKGYFVIDGQIVHEEDLSGTVTVETSSAGTKMKVQNVGFATTSFSVNLTKGIHYYEYYYLIRTRSSGLGGRYEYFWFSNTNNSMNQSGNADIKITAGTFTVSQDLYEKADGSRVIPTFDCSDYARREYKTSSEYDFNITHDSRKATEADIPPYVSPNSFQVTIRGINLKTQEDSIMSSDTLTWKNEVISTTSGDVNVWIATSPPTRTIDTSKQPYFLSSNPDITPRISEGEYIEGYQWQNIDIVGGGVTFYYRNFDTFGDIRVISMPSETSSSYVCNAISNSDIDNHVRFYATKYCPCSILMYFKNVANAADTNDVELGTIDFSYVNANFAGATSINLCTPSFKKGSGTFAQLNDFGTITGTGIFSLIAKFSATIKESGAKKACYCALDSQRNILGVFDANGNPGRGFLNTDGSVNTAQLMKIDQYVIALGASSNNASYSAWISEINFKYKSNEGYGGTFGSVEYRYATDKVESTIFNFFVNIPAGADILLSVYYLEDSQTIGDVTYSPKNYYITVISNVELTLNIYIYDSNYVFTFNGQEHEEKTAIGLKYTPPSG